MVIQSLSEPLQDAVNLSSQASGLGGFRHGGENEGLTKQQGKKKKKKMDKKRRQLEEGQLAFDR